MSRREKDRKIRRVQRRRRKIRKLRQKLAAATNAEQRARIIEKMRRIALYPQDIPELREE